MAAVNTNIANKPTVTEYTDRLKRIARKTSSISDTEVAVIDQVKNAVESNFTSGNHTEYRKRALFKIQLRSAQRAIVETTSFPSYKEMKDNLSENEGIIKKLVKNVRCGPVDINNPLVERFLKSIEDQTLTHKEVLKKFYEVGPVGNDVQTWGDPSWYMLEPYFTPIIMLIAPQMTGHVVSLKEELRKKAYEENTDEYTLLRALK